MASQILLYSGPGAGQFCTEALKNQLEDIYDDRFHRISVINSFNEIIYHPNPQSVKAIFIPGGHASLMELELSRDDTAKKITDLIDLYGTSYFGVCAGGIIASSSFFGRVPNKFSENGFFLHDRKTTLGGLFPGNSAAPLFKVVSDNRTGHLSIEDFKVLDIELTSKPYDAPLEVAHLYGPFYLGIENSPNIKVLTKYTNCPPISFGRGLSGGIFQLDHTITDQELPESLYYKRDSGAGLIATGSHPEISSRTILSEEFKSAFNLDTQLQRKISVSMESHDLGRKLLLKDYFEKLTIQCKPTTSLS